MCLQPAGNLYQNENCERTMYLFLHTYLAVRSSLRVEQCVFAMHFPAAVSTLTCQWVVLCLTWLPHCLHYRVIYKERGHEKINLHTVFPRIFSVETILFLKWKKLKFSYSFRNFLLHKLNSCRGKYSLGETIQGRKPFVEIQ